MTPEQVAARRRALDDDETGLAGTFLVEPLTALAGGILGGATVAAVAWWAAWNPGGLHHLVRRVRTARANR